MTIEQIQREAIDCLRDLIESAGRDRIISGVSVRVTLETADETVVADLAIEETEQTTTEET